ncbi:hypothetical protein C8A05DRAFT_32496 [Staphylotrichum tortipilum]|uniref:Uncharacterized protein n=1 Tax=Staphylotrichum tortipilum TaxID=2831512 RepID=A0AAN6MMQ4_9PEZI|nr:hypothetical protein C8A05DRAFT_32496 [Staphylotrichum longicolle]
MFDLPDAKRVRREDLYSSPDRDSSPEVEDSVAATELRAKLNARLSSLFALDAQPAPTTDEPESQDQEQDQDQDEPAEFAFRLFSTPAETTTAAAEVQKVVLAPDDEAEMPYTGPALSQRPLSSYIRGPLSPREQEQFFQAAVTGADVHAWAGWRAWGLEVPWRVTKISVVLGKGQQAKPGVVGVGGVVEKKKGKRPGKKSRIVLRKREKAKKEAVEAAGKQKVSKEEHLKEKKKRLNRERKLKRRQKEREKKATAKGEGAEGGGEASSDGGSDGEE